MAQSSIDLEIRPFPKQQEILNIPRIKTDDRGNVGIRHINVVSGRGFGKTSVLVIFLLEVVVENPGRRGFWAEPTHGDIDRVFMTALEDHIPSRFGLWKIKRDTSYRYIEWWNGHRTDLLARHIDNPRKRVALGSNYMYGFQDEAATGFYLPKFIDMQNAIRLPGAPYLLHVTSSTPLKNNYYDWCHQDGATTIIASSYDNPHLSPAAIDSMVASMPPELVQQEIYGGWITEEGRIWTGFEEQQWPAGNILEGYQYNANQPFYLGCDLGGAQAAFQLYQYIDPVWNGRIMFRGRLAVLVAEYPVQRQSLQSVCDDILRRYGRPARVFVGSDVVTPGTVGNAAQQVFTAIGWEYETPRGSAVDKGIQKNAAMALLHNTAGERRFAVAATKKNGQFLTTRHMGEGNNRSILEVLRHDSYPDFKDRAVFRKDKSDRGVNAMEDDRDAWLYWAICSHPPEWAHGTYLGAA